MFACSGLTCEELAALLKSARDAYSQLVMGGAVRVVVDQNGERVEFTAANASRLNSYIQLIMNEMTTQGCACAVNTPPPARAFKFIF
jgi:c-di-GMP-binding flagellar brake protein YcgR